jgi:hypothetical protein
MRKIIWGHLDVEVTIPDRFLSSRQATVAVSPDNDLANGLFIAFTRVLTENRILIRFMNSELVNLIINGNFYFTITEF